ncbi:MAG: aminotransferase class IV [Kiritimatiellae bacterium]|nr:aminotransferase class IV [Kiritimatiellia bacterium]
MATAVQTEEKKAPARVPASEWFVYLNGAYILRKDAMIHFSDAGFNLGDGIFDCLRTARHKPFKLQEHIDRFYRNLKYARIAPGLTPDEMTEICLTVLAKNIPFMAEHDDCWIFMRATRGSGERGPKRDFDWPYPLKQHPPTVMANCTPLNFPPMARLYREGRRLITSSIRAFPAECLEPRLKSLSRQHFMIACAEVEKEDPEAVPLLLDIHGNVAEPYGANIFFVRDGELMTPSPQLALEGISRQTTIDVAREQGIPVHEGNGYKPYDIYNADEAFVTMTSYGIVSVRSLDGVAIGRQCPGPMTMRLLRGFGAKMGIDLVAQAESHLS